MTIHLSTSACTATVLACGLFLSGAAPADTIPFVLKRPVWSGRKPDAGSHPGQVLRFLSSKPHDVDLSLAHLEAGSDASARYRLLNVRCAQNGPSQLVLEAEYFNEEDGKKGDSRRGVHDEAPGEQADVAAHMVMLELLRETLFHPNRGPYGRIGVDAVEATNSPDRVKLTLDAAHPLSTLR